MERAYRAGALIVAALAGMAPARAAVPPSPQALYVRARAAEVAGDAQAAGTDFAALLARDGGNDLVAQSTYRQALVAGDTALATRAARLLDRLHALPPDARLLLVVQAVQAGDLAAARAQVASVERERLFAFMAPVLRAWIAVGAHDADPLAALDAARPIVLVQPYLPEQRGLLLIATGRVEEGIAALRAAGKNGIEGLSVRTRLIAADALAGTGQQQRAMALVDGDEAPLAVAHARIAAGERLPGRIDGPAAGIAQFLGRVATDFGRQRLTPVAFTLTRLATILAPQDASGWLLGADLLQTMKRPRDALAMLNHVDAADPFAPPAGALRIVLLAQLDDRRAALDEATRGAARPAAGLADWARLGDVQQEFNRPADAAAAYARGIAAGEAHAAPADQLWPVYLQLGSARDLAGDWPGALVALRKAAALAPNQPLVLNQLGYAQIARRQDVAAASALIGQASRLRPDDPAITDSLGWAHYLQGETAVAVPLLEKAAAAEPEEPTINEHLGDAYWAAGRRYEARYAWRAAAVTAEDKDKARLSAKIDLGLTPATAAP